MPAQADQNTDLAATFKKRTAEMKGLLRCAQELAVSIDMLGAELKRDGYSVGGFRTVFATTTGDGEGRLQMPLGFNVVDAKNQVIFMLYYAGGDQFTLAQVENHGKGTLSKGLGRGDRAFILAELEKILVAGTPASEHAAVVASVKDGKLEFKP